jgi:excinuclease ABC subunit A
MIESINIRGARQHNLKNINLSIPRNRLTVITGLSGSGKSSLAFDTIYAEGQRRYMESLSSYARQFLTQMEKPDVDSIEGLSPAIAIEQKTTSHSRRSTVGTVTEIYDYLRLLFTSIGNPHCWQCGRPITRQTIESIADDILLRPSGQAIIIYAPVVRGRKGEFRKQFENYFKQGFLHARVDGESVHLEDRILLDRNRQHTVDICVDRPVLKEGIRVRLEHSLRTAVQLAEGLVSVVFSDGEERIYSERRACIDCGISAPEPEPRSFSFNSKYGACPDCGGLGVCSRLREEALIDDLTASLKNLRFRTDNPLAEEFLKDSVSLLMRNFPVTPETLYQDLSSEWRNIFLYGSSQPLEYKQGNRSFRAPFLGVQRWLEKRCENALNEKAREEWAGFFSDAPCPSCQGSRLRPESRSIKVGGLAIHELTSLPLHKALQTVEKWNFNDREQKIAGRLRQEVINRLRFLCEVGVEYITLDRQTGSLSGGESQRIRLAGQIGSRLHGVLYVLDEPSIGLHPRDNRKLLNSLAHLRDLGNTVLVVEHDEDTIRHADYLVDLGPGAGTDGGYLVYAGPGEEILQSETSLTGRYLSGKERIEVPEKRQEGDGRFLEVLGCTHHNLKNIDVRFPLGKLIAVTGVSGSGKSSLIDEILYRSLARRLYRSSDIPGEHREILGAEWIDKVIEIDQSPIGRTPRSNPATYTGLFTPLRDLFAMLPEARMRGYSKGHFSFNVKGGRCEACEGDGVRCIEMNFLPDVFVMCETCRGSRYKRETLEVRFKEHSIADLLNLTIQEAYPLLENIPSIQPKLQILLDVGLGYLSLGQSAPSLSGGEAQRVKLARELSKKATGKTLYILDEPTTGLHFEDVRKLLSILSLLVDRGNTVIVIEHHLDVIKYADWIIDLGPEGGDAGGYLTAQGTPEDVAEVRSSYTGRALCSVL